MAWWRRKKKRAPESEEGPDRESTVEEETLPANDSFPREIGVPEGFIVVDEDAARPADDPTRSPFWRDSHPEHRFFSQTRLTREELHSPPPDLSQARRTLYNIMDAGLRHNACCANLEPHSDSFRVRFKLEGTWCTVLEGKGDEFEAIWKELAVMLFEDPVWFHGYGHPNWRVIEIDFPDGAWMPVVFRWVWGTDGPIINAQFASAGEKGFVLDLDNLGIRQVDLVKIKRALDRPKGLILVCGPTGAGKSVLCYSALVRAQLQGRSVATVERPKKFLLPGTVQVGVEPEQTFRDGLEEALADDPEVLMFQDLWHHEDLLPALQQADRRLVICGYHRFSAVFALRSLLQAVCHGLDKEKDHSEFLSPQDQILPEALAQRLLLVTGSRLLPRLCPHCSVSYPLEVASLGKTTWEPPAGKTLVHFGTRGCTACNHSGFAGTEGIFEVLEVTPAIRTMISWFKKADDMYGDAEGDYDKPERLLESRAMEEGMRPMRHVALDKVLEGKIRLRHVLQEIPKPYGAEK